MVLHFISAPAAICVLCTCCLQILLLLPFSSTEKKVLSIEKHPLAMNVTLIPVECRCCLSGFCMFVFSGYDFGYMVKLLTDSRLPEEEHEFFHILNLFFPSIYDVKYLMKSCKNLKVLTSSMQTRGGWTAPLHLCRKPNDRTVVSLNWSIKSRSHTQTPKAKLYLIGTPSLVISLSMCLLYRKCSHNHVSHIFFFTCTKWNIFCLT